MKDFILGYIASHGCLTIFIAFVIEMLGVPIPGQTILLYIGYLTYDGQLSWPSRCMPMQEPFSTRRFSSAWAGNWGRAGKWY